tara:strand:- start:3418 stop:5508 length:2091 start_codon:yes stop_codon:yes gene_type:complete
MMKKYPIPHNEKERLKKLRNLDILDSAQEECFDDLTHMAAELFEVPIAIVSLVDENRQWFKSCVGIEADETSREIAFCAHAIMQNEVFVIEDATVDERFKKNPLVIDGPKIRFYAGCPLTIEDEFNLGTLCLIDYKPRRFSEGEIKQLKILARQVTKELVLKKRLEHLKSQTTKLQNSLLIERTQFAAKIGSWQVDIATNICIWSKMTYEIHEVDYNQPIKVEDGINFFIEEHKPIISKLVEDGIKEHKGWNVQLQIKTATDKLKWVHAIGYPVYEQNELVRLEGTFQDITEAKEREDQLQQEKMISEQALKTKSIFLANMSHEIRTPLNGIFGLSNLLLDKEIEGEVRRYVEGIKDSSESLLDIINDILDFSKIEAGKLFLEEGPVDLNKIIMTISLLFNPRVEQKGLHFDIEYDQDIPEYIFSDGGRIKQILYNLVGNAVKFTEKGTVYLYIGKEKTIDNKFNLVIKVKDSGLGIKKSSLEKLFQPFVQADNSVTKKYGGTGLGLSIVKEIVSTMKGTIAVDSKLGIGTEFIVKLPTFETKNENFLLCENKKFIENHSHILKELNCLLVEDNTINRLVAKKTLEKEGITHIQIAENGQVAVEMCEKQEFDIIFMDIQMPVMDGLQATQLIKEKKLCDFIIGLSANAFNEDKQKALTVGMDDYLAKPLKSEDLQISLTSYILRKKKSVEPASEAG